VTLLASETHAPVPTYPVGARVQIRGEEWVVRGSHRNSAGDIALRVSGLSELVRGREFTFVTPSLDAVTLLDPRETRLVQDSSPGYRTAKLYLESLLRTTPPTEPRVYLGHQAAMNTAPYQLVPAAKALSQPRPRILIADAVGLGKTIEAGILMSELIRRGRGERILVVALKSVLEQLQQELWARFTIPLVRLDSDGLARVQRKLPAHANPFHYYPRVIISIDTLKKDEKYRRFLEACSWDITLIDECQHVAVRAKSQAGRSDRARLAELLAGTSDALILTSATPHDGKPESFASLMNLLDPTAVADPESYTREDIAGLYVRRFKKDVAHEMGSVFRERALHKHVVPASSAEDAVYDALAKATFRTLKQESSGSGVLFRTVLLKGMLSSAEALGQTLEEREKKLVGRSAQLGVAEDLTLLQELREDAARATKARSSKLHHLLELLAGMGVGKDRDERVVVFSERIRTLHVLEKAIRERFGFGPEAVALFHGSLEDTRQQELVKEFGTEQGRVRVLLCSDAAAEGINLHFYCHRLVHYDIPWSFITLEQRNGRIDRFGQRHTPEIHYLLTEPSNSTFRGDLRILTLLVDKEEQAHKNLGDARWLLDLHDAEAEEARIARAISEHESPEELFPDLDTLDLDALLAGSTDDAVVPAELTVDTANAPTLYGSDLAFVREACQTLVEAKLMSAPEWHEEIQALTLQVPEDLALRFSFLPPELMAGGSELRLTYDRDLVQRSLADARRDLARFPEWQLLWPLHPVAGWLNDRLLTRFMRHEAPVVLLAGLPAGEQVFVVQGVLSNQASQPVVASWMAVRVADDALTVEPLADFLRRVDLKKALANDGRKMELKPLEALRARVVKAAEEHMATMRSRRAKELKPTLVAEKKRVDGWVHAREAHVAKLRAAREADGRKLRKDEEERLSRLVAEARERAAQRFRYVSDKLSTVDTPYVRIAMVLAGAQPG
jgi:Helicase conserved C-terminal domain/SNF2-related domain